MTTLTCARGCTQRQRHIDTCLDEQCAGCLPRLAATGLHVCEADEKRTREALRDLAAIDAEVTSSGVLRSVGRGSGGDPAVGPIPLDDDARQWREGTRAVLVGWCHILAEEFSASLDGAQDTVPWMADRLGVYAGRLMASEHADQFVSDFIGGWDDDGRPCGGIVRAAKRLIFRSRGGAMRILCSCGERVTVDLEPDAIMTCRGCKEWGTLEWWADREAGGPVPPMALRDLPEWLALTHGLKVGERQLRGWADTGVITAVQVEDGARKPGRPGRKYDPAAVAVVAMEWTGRRAG